MNVTEFIQTLVEREQLDDVDRIALARWVGPGHVLGVVFEVDGRWIHASDYGDLDVGDWQDVSTDEMIVVWEKR